MLILQNILVFLLALVLFIYIVAKIKYFKHNITTFRKNRFVNIIDATIVTTILLFSIFHLNSFIKSFLMNTEPTSYLKQIIFFLIFYLIWIYINVKVYRRKLKK